MTQKATIIRPARMLVVVVVMNDDRLYLTFARTGGRLALTLFQSLA
jgi:hypothetical protein